MEAQALSLGLPLLHIVIPKDADYKESYVSGMKKLKAGFTPPPQCDQALCAVSSDDTDRLGGRCD